jgi:hypothetical protein
VVVPREPVEVGVEDEVDLYGELHCLNVTLVIRGARFPSCPGYFDLCKVDPLS